MNKQKLKERKSKMRNSKGITLVALILTIIVLLILAVVAIGAVQNDGIINHAKNARDEYGKAQDNENTTLANYLGKIEENLPGNSGGGIQVTIDGTNVTLTQENFGEYLGKKVTNYKTGETETVTVGENEYTVSTIYRLYYIDFENKYGDGVGTIYLKADKGPSDYVLETNGNAETSKIQNLNPSLYAEGVTAPTSTNDNMKAVTWLTDTAKWSGLKTSGESTEIGDKVKYVVGAPSLEMMMDSYNTHYNLTGETPNYADIPASPDTTRRKLFYKYTSGKFGYQVGPNANKNVEYHFYTPDNSVKTDSEIDTMYYPGNAPSYYWLASPSAINYNNVMYVDGDYGGRVHNSDSYNYFAFCPLVSLKSDVSLELE